IWFNAEHMFCGLTQVTAAEKRRKKTRVGKLGSFSGSSHSNATDSVNSRCVYCGCSCGFFQPEKT
ncbi:hypothetical protein, partial [Escherichia coli]|uniref:hypothetical protein n=1 Tax=Escherichia coli TaxID=562 RepID=UPI001BC84194